MAKPIPTLIPDDVKARFWANVDVRGPDECWLWTGGRSGSGYGRFVCKGDKYLAHRLSMRLHGAPLPDGLVADHLCMERLCVNPCHLRAVTVAVNCVENSNSQSARNKGKTHCPRGHEYTPENTRLQRKRTGIYSRNCRTCQRILDRERYCQRKAALKGTDDGAQAD